MLDDLGPEFVYPTGGLTDSDESVRRGRITASVADMICGESEFGGPLRAYRQILGLERWGGSASTRLGKLYEPLAGALHQMRHSGTRLFRPGTRVHPDLDWLAATIDFLCIAPDGARYVLEAKYTDASNRAKWGIPGTDQVPPGYRVQVATQLAVWGLDRGVFGVLIDGADYREFQVERDLAFERDLLTTLDRFRLDHLVPRIPPDDGDRKLRTMTIYPAPVADIRDASDEPETIACAAEVARTARERARAQAAYERACAELCAQIGPSEGVQVGPDRFTWKRESRAAERVLRVPPKFHKEVEHVKTATI